MAYEFSARIPTPKWDSLKAWFRTALQNAGVEILDDCEGETSRMRWRGSALRAEWPEDITASLVDDDVLLISFHTGTAAQRQSVLVCLANQISSETGHPVTFEEV